MMFHDYSADVPESALQEFVHGQSLGRLVTASPDGQPHIGLYPFVWLGEHIEIHLHRRDEQLADLAVNAKCAFEVDQVHGTIPSHWLHPGNATFATANHRTVIFECDARVSQDVEVLAAQQQRLMRRYQPEGGHEPVSAALPMYRAPLGVIAALTLTVRARKVKWKLVQNLDRAMREKLIGALRARALPEDAGAADALQWTLDHEAAK